MRSYYVYIMTNPSKAVLYVRVTNDLARRIFEHFENRGKRNTFTGRYYCNKLIYYEEYSSPSEAIAREKQIKRWSRKKKIDLITTFNPQWNGLNGNFY